MAVEIPVVIDIDKAFQDAAKRVDTAMKPLQGTIDQRPLTANITIGNLENSNQQLKEMRKYYKDLEDADWTRIGEQLDLTPYINQSIMRLQSLEAKLNDIQELRRLEGGSGDFYFAEEYRKVKAEIEGVIAGISAMQNAQSQLNATLSSGGIQNYLHSLMGSNTELQKMNEYYRELEASSQKMSDSINAIRGRLADLNAEWNNLSKEDRQSARGATILNQAREETRLLKEEALTIDQILQKERKKSDLINQGIQKRRYENAILNASVTSMRVLQEQERILSDRLNRTNIQSGKYAELRDQLDQVRGKMQQMQGTVGQTTAAMGRQSIVLQNLTSMASMYVSVFGALRFVKQIRDVTAELEFQKVALGRLIQDEEYGAVLFERIKAAAVQSPFRIKDLVTYTKQLAAYRIEEENLFGVTQRLADISAGLGVDMNRLILAYGQVRSASVLRGQELRQFTEAGIPLVELLRDKFNELNGTSIKTADVFKLISDRAVPFSMIADIFEDLTNKGGMFYKMQEKQAETLKGRWEKLKDTYDIALQSIGDSKGLFSFRSYNNAILAGLNELAKGLRLVPKALEGGTLAWGVYYIATMKNRRALKAAAREQARAAVTAEVKAKADITGAKVTDAYTNALIRQKVAANGLSRAFWGLWAAIVANPVAAGIAAVAGLAMAFLSFRKNTDSAISALADYKIAVEDLAAAEKEYSKTDKLIDQYEALASKTERTEEENSQLYSTMSKLTDIFPDMATKINAETESLEANISALRERNKENEKLSRDEAEKKLSAAETSRGVLQKQLDDQLAAREKAYKKMRELDSLVNFYGYEDRRGALEKATARYNELDAQVQETKNSIGSLNESIESLENYLNPKTSTEAVKGWKEQIKQLNTYKTSLGNVPLFTDKEIEDLDSVYDYYKKLKKLWEDSTTSLDGLKTAYENAIDPIIKTKLFGEMSDAQARADAIKQAMDFFGFVFQKSSKGGTHQTDPFITQMQERMKFMQDFKKGYDDLRKYMTSSQALSEEAGVMLGRGTSLGMSAEEQARAASDLSKWYDDAIKAVQDKLKAKGVKGMSVTDFLGIDTTKKSKDIQDLQKLLQSLWDAKTDFDISQKKKDLEDALQKLSDEIKRSETARNFYNDILDLTGDEQLAATMGVSIYGDVGQDFKERLQGELNKALESVDASAMTDELRKAFSTQNFSVILANLDKFPEEWQKRLKEMAANSEKFQADEAKNLVKALERAKTYGEQRVEIAKKTAQRTAQIQAMNISEDAKSQLLKQNAKKEAEDSAKLAYEAFKDTPMYVELFANLDEASGRMLRNMRENLEEMKQNWKDLHPRELKELQSRLNELDEQIAQRNPFKALVESIKQYRELQKQQTRAEADQAAIDADARLKSEEALYEMFEREYHEAVDLYGIENGITKAKQEEMEAQAKVVDAAKKEAEEAQDTANSYRNVAKHIEDAAEKMQDWAGYVSDSLDGIGQIVSTFASDDVSETFDIIAEGIGKTIGGAAQLGKGISELIMLNPQGIVDTIQGLGSMISGIFGTKKQLSIKAINKKIDEQDRLLSQLSYSYGRLDAAMAKAFGSDYIYNYTEQLKNLQAQQAAYEEQARLESQKGKKKDQQKIDEFNQSAEEVKDQILDMQSQLSEFFAGSDLTSAAEDFANAWIEAYMEFGSTTDAISEKFKDMVNNMIVKSLAGKAMQNLLKPVFDEIDSLAIDGELTAAEIGRISAMATAAIPQINDAMTGLMNNLTTAGIDLRTHAGQFTGISRDFAGASEESILGLSAAVNTANFYISHVPAIAENVAAIRGALVGDTPANVRTTASEGPTYEDQMLGLVGSIPQMRDDMAAMRSMLERVIKPVGVSATHYVAVR